MTTTIKQNNKLIAFTALALLLTSGFPAVAQDGRDTPPPMGDERPFEKDGKMGKKGDKDHRGAEMFAKADKNKDGFITKDEMYEAHKARIDEMFAKADTDNDGKLSPEEMKKGHQAMREKFREKMKERMDKMKEMRGEKGMGGDHEMGDDMRNEVSEKMREKMKERMGGSEAAE